jgi:hypothetical protein
LSVLSEICTVLLLKIFKRLTGYLSLLSALSGFEPTPRHHEVSLNPLTLGIEFSERELRAHDPLIRGL